MIAALARDPDNIDLPFVTGSGLYAARMSRGELKLFWPDAGPELASALAHHAGPPSPLLPPPPPPPPSPTSKSV